MMVGVQNAAKTYDMLDAEGFIKYKNMAYEASSKPLLDDFATPKKIETILSFWIRMEVGLVQTGGMK